MYISMRIWLFSSIALISLCLGFTLKGKSQQRLKSRNSCQLQGQYCDLMDPDQQCCPGTSCGVKRNGDHVSNLCVVCRDLGQPCNATHGLCCGGLNCQKITEYASVCNPKSHKPFIPKTLSDNSYELNENRNF